MHGFSLHGGSGLSVAMCGSHWSECLEVVLEISLLHELQEDHDWVIDSYHSMQTDYIGVLELSKGGCLLKKSHFVLVCGLSVCASVLLNSQPSTVG